MEHKCQMTIFCGRIDGRLGSCTCNRPAKFRNPRPHMGIKFVCGIHAHSLDAMYKRINSKLRCVPILDKFKSVAEAQEKQTIEDVQKWYQLHCDGDSADCNDCCFQSSSLCHEIIFTGHCPAWQRFTKGGAI
jgi:hypothetical protein